MLSATRPFATYARFVKIEHTLFSLPLLFAGAVLAQRGVPPVRTLGLIVCAGVGARLAAMALNRLIDRHIDARNPRTASRELPAGTMRVREAVAILCAGLCVYVIAAYALAPVLVVLAPLPVLAFVVYPFMKRFTEWAHVGVGVSLAAAPIGGGLAVTRDLQALVPSLLLGLFTFFWASGFDIIYATLDEDFDRSEGLHSLPARRGRVGALRVSALFHACAFATLCGLVLAFLRVPFALVFLSLTSFTLFREQRAAENVDLAFFRLNVIVGILVLLTVLAGTLAR